MLTLTDLFAGAGGSSTGAVQSGRVEVRMAANHWQLACDIHNLNHPDADHAAVDLHEEDPRYFPRTDMLWASPECTKWSQAGSSKTRPAIEEGLFEDPLSDEAATRSRLLMFDVLRFIEHHRYRLVFVENVVDIATQAKYRLAWHEWRRQLDGLGYAFRVVSLNAMHAQLLGDPAPQSRDRIYVVCWPKGERAPDLDRTLRPRAYCPRCDVIAESQQAWKPGRTVGRYRQAYAYVHGDCGTVVEPGYLPALAAIDLSVPGQLIGDRSKDIAAKTRARIAAGIARYWLPLTIEAAGHTYDAADPRHPSHGDPDAYYRAWPATDPLTTIHTTASKALAVPVEGREGKEASLLADALRTLTTRNETALAWPFLAELRGGGSDARSIADAAATICASGNHHALITRHYGIPGGDPARHTTPALEELRTMTANAGNMSLVTPYYGRSEAAYPAHRPLGTVTTVDRAGLVVPSGGTWNETAVPTADALRTITTREAYALVMRNNSGGAEMTTPVTEYLRTITTAGHQSLIFGPPRGARPKVTEDALRVAESMVDGCQFRMIMPREVAAAMAFPDDYRWDVRDSKGKLPSNRNLVRAQGNAVCPPCARDIVGVSVESVAA